MAQLYINPRLAPLKVWPNGPGVKTRAQISDGKPLNVSKPTKAGRLPKAEGPNQYNRVDIYRLQSGAAKLEDKVLSSEPGPSCRR